VDGHKIQHPVIFFGTTTTSVCRNMIQISFAANPVRAVMTLVVKVFSAIIAVALVLYLMVTLSFVSKVLLEFTIPFNPSKVELLSYPA